MIVNYFFMGFFMLLAISLSVYLGKKSSILDNSSFYLGLMWIVLFLIASISFGNAAITQERQQMTGECEKTNCVCVCEKNNYFCEKGE